MHVAVVVPCYKVGAAALKVIAAIGAEVKTIICVDDACPIGSGRLIAEQANDPRVAVVFHERNAGVGGAMISGFRAALAAGADIVVKVDGDGQMDPALIPFFVKPIREGRADYTKGNRFYRLEDVGTMPATRLLGNAVLSFFSKLSSGYWGVFDPTNGYIAIHANVLRNLPLEKLSPGYFFESDMLFRLNVIRAVVADVPMRALYGDAAASNLRIGRVVLPFLYRHVANFFKRIVYNYFLRDFSVASCELVLGLLLLAGGTWFGIDRWIASARTGELASAGTVMLAALPVIVGLQLLLGFLNYDIANVPSRPIHDLLP